MPVPTSGPVSARNVNVEFNRGGTTQVGFSQMYRGGPFVDATDSVTTIVESDGPSSGPFLTVGTTGWIVRWDPRDFSINALYWGGRVVGTVLISGPLITPFTVRFSNFRYGVGLWTGITVGPDRWYPVSRTQIISTPVTTVVDVNTQVPDSGQISLGNLRGARNF